MSGPDNLIHILLYLFATYFKIIFQFTERIIANAESRIIIHFFLTYMRVGQSVAIDLLYWKVVVHTYNACNNGFHWV